MYFCIDMMDASSKQHSDNSSFDLSWLSLCLLSLNQDKQI